MKSTPAPTPPAAPAPDPERGAGIIARTVELMREQGYGWSKAMEAARREATPPPSDDDYEFIDA